MNKKKILLIVVAIVVVAAGIIVAVVSQKEKEMDPLKLIPGLINTLRGAAALAVIGSTNINRANACSGSGVTTTGLTNRTGHEWVYSFSDTGKTLPMPRADWTKGATHQRPNNLADTYYTTYTQMTGKTLIRSLYDVHHIQPLSYGGDNSYSNLIHLPKALHSQVTGWFNGY